MAFQILHSADFTIERVRKRDMLLIDVHWGAYAHGIQANVSPKNSYRGVFVAPNSFLLGLEDITIVSEPQTDQVYYEIRRFIELLSINNPLVMEMLNMPPDSVRYRNGLFGILTPELFLSKLCARTYTEHAQEELSKILYQAESNSARPAPPRKKFSEFCYIDGTPYTVVEWLKANNLQSEHCGLASVPHTKACYKIYIDKAGGYKGLFLGDPSNTNVRLLLSDIPEGETPAAYLIFDEKEFTIQNRAIREHIEREEQRIRWEKLPKADFNHTFMDLVRLLTMAIEIAKEGEIITRRPDVQELLKIRNGEYSFSYMLGLVKNLIGEVLVAFRTAPLPLSPNKDKVLLALLEIRSRFLDKSSRPSEPL